MKQQLPNQSNNEEVDLGQLFKLIGNTFDKLYGWISGIFKGIFSIFIYALKAVFKNFKIIALSMIIASIIGFFVDKYKKDIYQSKMMVKPYFESKYQLVNNIDYYNALIGEENYEQLMDIFDIEQEAAKNIIEFQIQPGPETDNDRRLDYESYIKRIDSTRALDMTFKEFVDNRNIYSASLFEISVKAYQKDIFKSLENGLNSNFSNPYSKKMMKKRDSIISIEKSRIIKSLQEVDSLQKIYVEVLIKDSDSKNKGTLTLKDGMSLVQERVKTREYELLEKQISLRKALEQLESKKVQEDVFFDTLSNFSEVGLKFKNWWDMKVIVLPILTFILLVFGYCSKRVIVFTNNYE